MSMWCESCGHVTNKPLSHSVHAGVNLVLEGLGSSPSDRIKRGDQNKAGLSLGLGQALELTAHTSLGGWHTRASAAHQVSNLQLLGNKEAKYICESSFP